MREKTTLISLEQKSHNKVRQRTCKTVTRFAKRPAKQAPFLQAAAHGVMFQGEFLPVSHLKITRHEYEEPYHVNLVFEAANQTQSSILEYYCNASDLFDIAERLEAFPRHNRDVYLYEFGSEKSEDNFSYYFRMRVFLINATGKCAIQIRTNNNKALPEREISEFCILAEPSQINSLGQLFRAYSKLNHKILEWTVDEGHLS